MTLDSFGLGRWTVEPAFNRISCSALVVVLEPKVMRLLVCLAHRPGAVVTRNELIEEVWEGVHVVDGAVGRAVYQLRKALASAGGDEHYVETVRQVGYRLTVDVVRRQLAVIPRRAFSGEPVRLRDVALVFCAAVLVGGTALDAGRLVFSPSDSPAFRPALIVADIVPPLSQPAMSAQGQAAERTVAERGAGQLARKVAMGERMAEQTANRLARQTALRQRMAERQAERDAAMQERREARLDLRRAPRDEPRSPESLPSPPSPASPESPPSPPSPPSPESPPPGLA